MNREFQKTEDGKFWAAVGSYHDILMAKDLIGEQSVNVYCIAQRSTYFLAGLQRALGSSFFARGYFPLNDYATFSSNY